MYKVYCYTNLITNQKYIGCTKLKTQIERSGRNGKAYIMTCRAFGEAIQQYGWDSFQYKILEDNLTKEQSELREQFWINELNTIFPNGYNLESGGKHCKSHFSTREIISKNTSGQNNPMYHHIYSAETIEKMKRNHADVSGEKNPMYGIHRYGEEGTFYNKHHTEETKKKLSEYKLGKHWFNNGVEECQLFECPIDWFPGRLKKATN